MTPEQALALRQPFPPESIGKLPKPYKRESPKGQCRECGGYHGLPAVHLDYVGHAATTDRLLAVDPEWTWEPLALDEHGLPALDRSGNLWIRLTVCGVTRLGVGDGSSAKEAIGDAIRNAAMRFGVALDLWAKEDLLAFAEARGEKSTPAAPTAAAPTPAPDRGEDRGGDGITKAQLGKVGAQMRDLGITDRDEALRVVADVVGRAVESRNDLTKQEASKLVEYLDFELSRRAS